MTSKKRKSSRARNLKRRRQRTSQVPTVPQFNSSGKLVSSFFNRAAKREMRAHQLQAKGRGAREAQRQKRRTAQTKARRWLRIVRKQLKQALRR